MCANKRFCCLSSEKSNESLNSIKNKEPVIINIYDMCKANKCMSPFGIGIFHSGVEVYGAEYTYVGHDIPFSGIFEISPRQAHFLSKRFKYRESIIVGYTDLSIEQFEDLISDMGEAFSGESYHLFYHNCNHFTSTLSRIICGRDIPKWINRLAKITSNIPFAHKLLPTGWISPASASKDSERNSGNFKKGWLKFMERNDGKVQSEISETFTETDATSTDDDTDVGKKSNEQKIKNQKERRNLTDDDLNESSKIQKTNDQSERNEKKKTKIRNSRVKTMEKSSTNI